MGKGSVYGRGRGRGRRTRVTGVGVGFDVAFGDFDVVLVTHLVEGAFAAR